MDEGNKEATDEQAQPSLAQILSSLRAATPTKHPHYARRSSGPVDGYYPAPDGFDDYGSVHALPPKSCSPEEYVTIRLSKQQLWWVEWRLRVHINSYCRVNWPAMQGAITGVVEILQAVLKGERGPDTDPVKMAEASRIHQEGLHGRKHEDIPDNIPQSEDDPTKDHQGIQL